MQNKKLNGQEYVLFSIPIDMIEEADIGEESVIRISAGKGQIIIEVAKGNDSSICIGICEECPIDKTDCDGECDICPCKNKCEYSEVKQY